MAIVTRTDTPAFTDTLRAHGETRLLLRNVPWTLYEVLRAEDANDHVRMTYVDGDLELMTVSLPHERYSVWFGLFIIELARVLRFPIISCRCTTWKKKGRGQRKGKATEADDCFYIASREKMRGKQAVDLKADPPPDLAIEIELSERAFDVLQVYGALRVPEVWRFDGASLRVCVRQPDGAYKESRRSPALPFVRIEEIVHWLERAAELDDDAQFCEEVGAWARDVLVPRRNA